MIVSDKKALVFNFQEKPNKIQYFHDQKELTFL